MMVEIMHSGRVELEGPDAVPREVAESAVGSIWNMLVGKIRVGRSEMPREVAVADVLCDHALQGRRGSPARVGTK